jgi:hypothetical protein
MTTAFPDDQIANALNPNSAISALYKAWVAS